MSHLSENPYDRKPISLDGYRLRLESDRHEGTYKAPTLQISKDMNNFRFEIWMNKEEKTPPIKVRLNIRSMLNFLELTKKVLTNRNPDESYSVSALTLNDEKQKVVENFIEVKFDREIGVHWVVTTQDQVKIPFYFKGDAWAGYGFNGQPMAKEMLSVLDAGSTVSLLKRLIINSYDNEYLTNEQEKEIIAKRKLFSEQRRAGSMYN